MSRQAVALVTYLGKYQDSLSSNLDLEWHKYFLGDVVLQDNEIV